jgi:hypothetical protein
VSAAFALLGSVPLKCSSASRCHHLLKTFWDWLDRQLPDGTVIWTSPAGQTYTTHPGSLLLFPSLCRLSAPVSAAANAPGARPNRGLRMPRRKNTRAHDRAQRIQAERARNREAREKPENAWDGGNPENIWESYYPSDRRHQGRR